MVEGGKMVDKRASTSSEWFCNEETSAIGFSNSGLESTSFSRGSYNLRKPGFPLPMVSFKVTTKGFNENKLLITCFLFAASFMFAAKSSKVQRFNSSKVQGFTCR